MWISKRKLESIKANERKIHYDYRYNELHKNYTDILSRLNTSEHEYGELQKKIREQTKNDMIAEALKVIMEGIKPETTKNVLLDSYNNMLAQQQQIALYRPTDYNPQSSGGRLF